MTIETTPPPVKQPLTILSCIGSSTWKEEIKKVIPKEIVLEAMIRVARSAGSDSKLANCNPKSFLQALLKCARAGLYPDGREAHLVAFGDDVQALFDWKGLVALANRAGYLVTPKLVFSNDEFVVEEDDGSGKTKVTHRADYRRPRGELQAVYSRAVRPDGQVDYELMTSEEVEEVRQRYSRAKNSTPWKDSYGEMMKKTVIKRHSKRWDMSPDIRAAINADDDSPLPLGESRVSAPIFSSSPKLLPAQPIQTSAPSEPILKLRSLCKNDGIGEDHLLGFMVEIGACEEDVEKLEDVPNETLLMTLEQWADISRRIKEAK